MLHDDLSRFLVAALQASIYVAPRDHGLSGEELLEVAKRAGYGAGEVRDALQHLPRDFHNGKLRLHSEAAFELSDFNEEHEPEHRDWRAFDAIRQHLIALAKDVGRAKARLPHDVLVEQVVAKGFDRHAVEV